MGVALASALVFGLAAAPASAQPSCGQTITQDTKLDADLNCFGASDRVALFIGADGITLDLGGHTISAERSIVNDGHDDVTIRNGTFDNDDGPLIEHASGTRLRNLRFQGITVGLDLVDAHDSDVRASEFPGAALYMENGSSSNTVARNRFRYSEGSVEIISGSNHNRVVDNDFGGPAPEVGIDLSDADENQIARNRISGTFGGISLSRGSDGNTIAHNVVRPEVPLPVHNITIGIALSDSSRNVLLRNNTLGTRVGFQVRAGSGNWLVNNRAGDPVLPVTGADADGFRVEAGASGTVLASNRAHGAVDDGIDVEAPGTFLSRNTANRNGDLGIEAVPGIIDLGGNRASGNGNPLQCLNVVCG